MRDYAGFGDPSSQKNALLVECGQHWEQASRKVAIETMFRFLKATHLADDALLADHGIAGAPPAQKFVTVPDEVTIESDDFVFDKTYTDRKSGVSGKSVSGRVDSRGRRFTKQKT